MYTYVPLDVTINLYSFLYVGLSIKRHSVMDSVSESVSEIGHGFHKRH